MTSMARASGLQWKKAKRMEVEASFACDSALVQAYECRVKAAVAVLADEVQATYARSAAAPLGAGVARPKSRL